MFTTAFSSVFPVSGFVDQTKSPIFIFSTGTLPNYVEIGVPATKQSGMSTLLIALTPSYTVSAVSVTRSAVFTKSTTSSALDTALTTVPPPVAKGTARDTTSAASPTQAQGSSGFLTTLQH